MTTADSAAFLEPPQGSPVALADGAGWGSHGVGPPQLS